jgi:hypothetical protein
MKATTHATNAPCGAPAEEARQLEAMVADYQTLIVPRSFQYWLESVCAGEAARMRARFFEMVDAEVARRGEDERDGARADVLFRIGFALGRSLAGGAMKD